MDYRWQKCIGQTKKSALKVHIVSMGSNSRALQEHMDTKVDFSIRYVQDFVQQGIFVKRVQLSQTNAKQIHMQLQVIDYAFHAIILNLMIENVAKQVKYAVINSFISIQSGVMLH